MVFFAFDDVERYFGTRDLAPGVRVRFDSDRFFAARERHSGHPIDRHVASDDGLVVHEVGVAPV